MIPVTLLYIIFVAVGIGLIVAALTPEGRKKISSALSSAVTEFLGLFGYTNTSNLGLLDWGVILATFFFVACFVYTIVRDIKD